jgi:hypothetical protein
MRLFFIAAALATCSVLSAPEFTSAAVIARDWKAPGDGLLTFDTVNQREWLDLSQTDLTSQLPATGHGPLEIRELRYQYIVNQTGPSGLFSGFSVAKSADVLALAESAGIDAETDDPANLVPTAALVQLLSITKASPDGRLVAEGLLDEFRAEVQGFPLRTSSVFHTDNFDEAGLRITYSQAVNNIGVMLYRNAIPEPTACALTVLALSTLTARRFFST